MSPLGFHLVREGAPCLAPVHTLVVAVPGPCSLEEVVALRLLLTTEHLVDRISLYLHIGLLGSSHLLLLDAPFTLGI